MPNGLLLQQAGQGNAYILPRQDMSGMANLARMKAAQEAAKQKREMEQRAIRDKHIDELMKWTPDQAWYPHQEQLNNAVDEAFQFRANMIKNDDLSPEARLEYERRKQRAASISAKSQDIQKNYDIWKQQINQGDKYTDKNYLQSKLNDQIFGLDGNKDVNEIDFQGINDVVQGRDPNAFKVQEWASDFAKTLPETIENNLGKYNAANGQFITNEQVKSKFFDLDENGNVVYQNGKPVIKVNDETVGLALQEPRTQQWVEQQLQLPQNKYKTEKDIVTELLSPYANIQSKTTLTKGFKPPSAGKGKDDMEGISWTYDQPWKTNVGQGGSGIADGYLPTEIRLGGKKLDKKIMIRSGDIIDESTNQRIPENDMVGDKEMKVTRIAVVPKSTSTGKYTVRSQAQLENDPNTTYEWVAFGQMIQKKGGREIVKNVMIPYNQVSNDVDAAYQLNLYNRDLREATPQEIVATINAYYGNISAQEKAAIYKRIMETGSLE